MIRLRSIAGVAGLPKDVGSLRRKFEREDVPISKIPGWRRPELAVSAAHLTNDVRLAYLRRDLETRRLAPGICDDVAHEAFPTLSPERRERAERKAGMARLLVGLGSSAAWPERDSS